MVVYQDYRCLLTGSSLVDYNDDEITPYHILPSNFYHLQRVHFILWQVVWETTLPYITICTTIYWKGQSGRLRVHRRGILYFTSSSSKVHKYVQAAAGVCYTIQAAGYTILYKQQQIGMQKQQQAAATWRPTSRRGKTGTGILLYLQDDIAPKAIYHIVPLY